MGLLLPTSAVISFPLTVPEPCLFVGGPSSVVTSASVIACCLIFLAFSGSIKAGSLSVFWGFDFLSDSAPTAKMPYPFTLPSLNWTSSL